jgi:carbamoyl-phosphate synthase large subunit
MINILISGVGGDVAQGVIKCLQKSALKTEIYKIGHNTEESWLYKDNLSFLCPPISSDEYVDYLCSFIDKHKIDVFIPCIDSEIYKISSHAKRINSQTGCRVVVGDIEKILICEDKYQTYKFLKDNNFSYPETYLYTDNIYGQFPCILKSKSGCGSKDIFQINNEKELKNHFFGEQQILQERLDGDEYTAGIYLGNDKEIRGVCIFKRKLKCGSTNFAERIIDKEMESYVCSIAKKLGLNYVNIQFKLKGGIPCPFEFNGRFSGTTGIISRVFNAPEIWLRENIMNEYVEPCTNEDKFYVMRYAEEIYASEEEVNSLIDRSQND